MNVISRLCISFEMKIETELNQMYTSHQPNYIEVSVDERTEVWLLFLFGRGWSGGRTLSVCWVMAGGCACQGTVFEVTQVDK